MRYRALATDFDGTLAAQGIVAPHTVAALEQAKQRNIALLMVTGRQLPSLLATFDRVGLFDLVVAENGAVLYVPSTQQIQLLSPPPPASLLDALEREQIPVSVGHGIVATVVPHDRRVLELLPTQAPGWHVIYNKGAAMVLASGVTKASGATTAFRTLSLDARDVVGIGDAENDHAFLQVCGLAVSVANGLPELRAQADLVTAGARGDGVCEIIERLLRDDLPAAPSHREFHADPAG